MTTPTADLSAAGVSIWLDDLSRQRITTGNLQELIDTRNVVGVTTNPTIFRVRSRPESDTRRPSTRSAPPVPPPIRRFSR